ncbi:microfibril-associated glycoprotein 4 [Lingula anatina]|uniref:Microfibril-associated glycoprotein 4 n=1 Tax=Lingula anatina TaxID=7574 RepID=A0A1S3IQ79_LINAN|nr:microfibril-associated glycoprotein 4 [Lingula anatina]|eukprot:XP_013400372.1 microfibril-associated glycoprotein 4 [Lingula anatina]
MAAICLFFLLLLPVVATQSYLDNKPKIDQCSFTFNIPGRELKPQCESQELEQAIQTLEQQNERFKEDNENLRLEINSVKRSYDQLASLLAEVKEQTDRWKEAISMPNFKPLFKPEGIDPIREIFPDTIKGDCQSAFDQGMKKPGIYTLQPEDSQYGFVAYCDSGWTVLQRRFEGKVDFYRDYGDYLAGFGNVSGEYWIGLEAMHMLTAARPMKLRVEAQASFGKWYYAEYDNFKIEDEANHFRISVGTLSDTNYKDGLEPYDGLEFSTLDKDYDSWYYGSCAGLYRGGWWFGNCGGNINLPHGKGPGRMEWADVNVVKSLMKIRPLESTRG